MLEYVIYYQSLREDMMFIFLDVLMFCLDQPNLK